MRAKQKKEAEARALELAQRRELERSQRVIRRKVVQEQEQTAQQKW